MRSDRAYARSLWTAFALGLLVDLVHVGCASARRAESVDAPNAIRGEAPHIKIKVDKPLIRPGGRVFAKAYGRGELRGGWICTRQLWRTDESPWRETGASAGAQCGEQAESWIWPDGVGREYRFPTPGPHEVCVEVYTRQGWLIGRDCARVDVVGGEQ